MGYVGKHEMQEGFSMFALHITVILSVRSKTIQAIHSLHTHIDIILMITHM